MSDSILIDLKQIYEKTTGKVVDVQVLANTLGLVPKLENEYEIAFLKATYSVLNKGGSSKPVKVEPEPPQLPSKYQIGTDDWWANVVKKTPASDKTLVSYLKTYSPDMFWRDWMRSSPDTPASRISRLRYLVKWGEGGMTEGIDSDVLTEVRNLLAFELKQIKTGEVTDVGVKKLDKKQKDILSIKETLDDADFKIKSLFHLFGRCIPPRRPSDFSNFWVLDKHNEEMYDMNSWSLSEQSFKFVSFKNSSQFGVQIFPKDEIRQICYSPEKFDMAIDILNGIKPDTQILGTSNFTSQFIYHNKINNNAYRHFYESVVAPTLDKALRTRLRYWLCHDVGTAEAYYAHDV